MIYNQSYKFWDNSIKHKLLRHSFCIRVVSNFLFSYWLRKSHKVAKVSWLKKLFNSEERTSFDSFDSQLGTFFNSQVRTFFNFQVRTCFWIPYENLFLKSMWEPTFESHGEHPIRVPTILYKLYFEFFFLA